MSVQSILSRDPSIHITKNLEFVNGLVSAFQHVVPAVRELGSGALSLDDVRVAHQYRALCRNVHRGAQDAIVLAELVEGVVRMSRDEDRRARIYDELDSAQGAYPKLRDFEAELRVRLEGVRKMQAKLATLSQQIEQESSALLRSTSSSSRYNGTLRKRYALLARNIAFGALSFGTLLLALGLVDKGPLYSPALNKYVFILLHISFGGAMAACLDGWKHYSASLQGGPNGVNLVDETLNSFVSELKQIVLSAGNDGAKFGTVVHDELPVSEVKVALDRFFAVNVDSTQIETSKALLQEVISSVYSYLCR